MSRWDHVKANAEKRVRREWHESREEQRDELAGMAPILNLEQREQIARLLQHPECTIASVRGRLESMDVWLAEHETRSLLPGFVTYLSRLERALNKVAAKRAAGHEIKPFVPDPKRMRRCVNKVARAPRPAWMDDPSLLPKRPPGAR